MGLNEQITANVRLSDMPLTSEKCDEILPALLAARRIIGVAVKNETNDDIGNAYADFTRCMEVVEGPLLEQSILVEFYPLSHVKEGIVEVMCQLTHVPSGQFRRATLAAASNMDSQSVGSSTTYLKRYTVSALTGLKTKDDDGNAGSRGIKGKGSTNNGGSKPAAAVTIEPATGNQMKLIRELVVQKGVELPDEVVNDRKRASAFIDELKKMKDVAPAAPASEAAAPAADAPAPAEAAAAPAEAEAAPAAEVAVEAAQPTTEGTSEAAPAESQNAPSEAYTSLVDKWKEAPKSQAKADTRKRYVKEQLDIGKLTQAEHDKIVAELCVFTA